MEEMQEAYFIVTDDNQVYGSSFATCKEAYDFIRAEFTEEEQEHLHVEVW